MDDVEHAAPPAHMDGIEKAEEQSRRTPGEESERIPGPRTGADRPSGSRRGADPARPGQQGEGMRKGPGTQDPDAPDPSGGAV